MKSGKLNEMPCHQKLESYLDENIGLEQRKKKAEEERGIRAEQRAEEKRRVERGQAAAKQVKQDSALLLMYKTQMNGAADLPTAGSIVSGLHDFFMQRPQYLNASNRAFLQKYPSKSTQASSGNKYVLRQTVLSHLPRLPS